MTVLFDLDAIHNEEVLSRLSSQYNLLSRSRSDLRGDIARRTLHSAAIITCEMVQGLMRWSNVDGNYVSMNTAVMRYCLQNLRLLHRLSPIRLLEQSNVSFRPCCITTIIYDRTNRRINMRINPLRRLYPLQQIAGNHSYGSPDRRRVGMVGHCTLHPGVDNAQAEDEYW